MTYAVDTNKSKYTWLQSVLTKMCRFIWHILDCISVNVCIRCPGINFLWQELDKHQQSDSNWHDSGTGWLGKALDESVFCEITIPDNIISKNLRYKVRVDSRGWWTHGPTSMQNMNLGKTVAEHFQNNTPLSKSWWANGNWPLFQTTSFGFKYFPANLVESKLPMQKEVRWVWQCKVSE